MQVYADNAATTKMSAAAIAAMTSCFEGVYGNPSSLHSIGQQAKEVLEDARARVAKCLGCEPREIIFTSGGSEIIRPFFPQPGWGSGRERSTSFPLLLSIMLCCIP